MTASMFENITMDAATAKEKRQRIVSFTLRPAQQPLTAGSIQREWFSTAPIRALEYLETVIDEARSVGYCQEIRMVPSKRAGYVQLSWGGANKFCTLGDMLGWARGIHPGEGMQVSHRCHNPRCMLPSHITIETPIQNNARKGCLVWVDCPHSCEDRILVCSHLPSCIKFVPGFETWEDFIRWGVH